MSNKLQKFGEGLRVDSRSTYVDGDMVDIDDVKVDLSNALCMSTKISLDVFDTDEAKPGDILMISGAGQPEWIDPLLLNDKILRDEYPSLQIAWDTVMEALHEYELVKKLVQDYDK